MIHRCRGGVSSRIGVILRCIVIGFISRFMIGRDWGICRFVVGRLLGVCRFVVGRLLGV